MNNIDAQDISKNMSYQEALHNVFSGKSIPYRKATFMKLTELVTLAEKLDMNEEDNGTRKLNYKTNK
jgi:hypothetical protein